MKVTFFGAANQVTGSCFLLEENSTRFLVDCGMFQGPRKIEKLNRIPNKLDSKNIDAVLITHGHLDHCGRLPMLVKSGYKGPIYATQGTIEIATLILKDAAHIQLQDTKRENRKRQRAGQKSLNPLFDHEDVKQVVKQFIPKPYFEKFSFAKNLEAQFIEAGHILGSSSIEIYDNSNQNKYIFSGDLGPYNVPLMRNPTTVSGASVVLLESTYGDRDHRPLDQTIDEFKEIINDTVKRKGIILIPSFAVGRTQQIIYYLKSLVESKEIEPIPTYLDSPMAIAATEIYLKHSEIMDEEGKQIIENGHLRNGAFKLTTCQTLEESQKLNSIDGPCVIIAGAGMCNAGRILHHFKHNLWKPSTVVIMVGYQAQGSLGENF